MCGDLLDVQKWAVGNRCRVKTPRPPSGSRQDVSSSPARRARCHYHTLFDLTLAAFILFCSTSNLLCLHPLLLLTAKVVAHPLMGFCLPGPGGAFEPARPQLVKWASGSTILVKWVSGPTNWSNGYQARPTVQLGFRPVQMVNWVSGPTNRSSGFQARP